jgi:hypothetical protein
VRDEVREGKEGEASFAVSEIELLLKELIGARYNVPYQVVQRLQALKDNIENNARDYFFISEDNR